MERIKSKFQISRRSCGSRRIRRVFLNEGITISRQRVIRLTKAAELICKNKRKFNATTNKLVAHNLLARNFTINEPNRYYVGDITYIITNEG